MQPRYLWLLLPLAAWSGYMTAPKKNAADQGGAGKTAAEARDPQVIAMAAGLAQATAADLAEEMRNLLTQPDSPQWTKRLKLICARWVEVDPAGALAWCEKNQAPTVVRLRLLTEWALLHTEWAHPDSDAAWASIPAGKEGDDERVSVTSLLLTEDPDIFMKWFRRVRRPLPDALPAWLRVAERYDTDLEEIAGEILRAGGADASSNASHLFALVARVRAANDPADTVKWAAKLEDLPSRRAATRAAWETWVTREPQEVWRQLGAKDADPLGSEMAAIGKMALERIAKEDPAAAARLVDGVADPKTLSALDARVAMESAFVELVAGGKLKPLEAYRLCASIKADNSFFGLNVMDDVFRALPSSQLEDTAKAIAAEPPGDFREIALSNLTGAWMAKDPDAAAAFIAAIPDEGLKAQAYAGCLQTAGESHLSPQRLTTVLQAIPAADRAQAFASFIGQFGDYAKDADSSGWAGPELRPEVLAPAFKGLPPSAELNRSVGITALEWGKSDPAAALAWAAELPDAATRSSAWAGTFESWAARNANAAAGWLADKPAGQERDAAALPVVKNLVRADPEVAWEWSESIRDAGLRQEARLATLKVWVIRDAPAAQAAYKQISSTLSAAEAAKLSSCFSGS